MKPFPSTASLLLLATLAQGASATAPDAPALLRQYKCTICHARDESSTGPSWREVAAKYRGRPQAEVVAKLSAEIRRGKHGAGPWPMPPSPQASPGDAERMIRYILSQHR